MVLSKDAVHSKSNIVFDYTNICIVSQRPYAYVTDYDIVNSQYNL